MVGNDEQYAAVMALLAGEVGVPARVVLGAVVPDDGVVTGKDVQAWVELRAADGSWRTLRTEKFMSNEPPAEQLPETNTPMSGTVVPPPAPIPPPSDAGDQSDADLKERKAKKDDAGRGGLARRAHPRLGRLHRHVRRWPAAPPRARSWPPSSAPRCCGAVVAVPPPACPRASSGPGASSSTMPATSGSRCRSDPRSPGASSRARSARSPRRPWRVAPTASSSARRSPRRVPPRRTGSRWRASAGRCRTRWADAGAGWPRSTSPRCAGAGRLRRQQPAEPVEAEPQPRRQSRLTRLPALPRLPRRRSAGQAALVLIGLFARGLAKLACRPNVGCASRCLAAARSRMIRSQERVVACPGRVTTNHRTRSTVTRRRFPGHPLHALANRGSGAPNGRRPNNRLWRTCRRKKA